MQISTRKSEDSTGQAKGILRQAREFALVEGSLFIKNRLFCIHEKFNKLIYGINTIKKMWHLAACKISVNLSVLKRIKNGMIFFIVSLN